MDLNYIYDNMSLEKYKGKFEYLQRIIGINAKVILEIGGHYGEDTLRFYKYFPHSKIYSFEPDPRNIQIFKKICSNIPSIQLIEKAVSDKHNDSILFYMAYSDMKGKLQDKYNFINEEEYKILKLNNSGSSSIKKSTRKDLINSENIMVDTIKLDNWVIENNIDKIDLIWIDVQGAEKDVIIGSKNILNNVNFILLEYGETEYENSLTKKETYDIMVKNNFQLIIDMAPNNSKGDFLFKNKNII
jgi:FkbM family methyltransferase